MLHREFAAHLRRSKRAVRVERGRAYVAWPDIGLSVTFSIPRPGAVLVFEPLPYADTPADDRRVWIYAALAEFGEELAAEARAASRPATASSGDRAST